MSQEALILLLALYYLVIAYWKYIFIAAVLVTVLAVAIRRRFR